MQLKFWKILLLVVMTDLVTEIVGCSVTSRKECSKHQFKCKNENKNQILSINDFNKEKEKCIPLYYRCDGRHDCQDGSDENDCNFSNIKVNKKFMCYEGYGDQLSVKDCIKADLLTPTPDIRPRDYLSLTLSVSESSEWVCTKTVFTNGSIVRGCQKTYTGGETFSMCFYSDMKDTPKRCLCSRQLCNSSNLFQQKNLLLNVILLSFYFLVAAT